MHGALADRAKAQEETGGETGGAEWSAIQSSAEAAAEKGEASLKLGVDGMVCPACAWFIEDLGRRTGGLRYVEADGFTRTVLLRWRPGTFDLSRFAALLRGRGYALNARTAKAGPFAAFAARGGVCALLCANAALLQWPLRDGGNAGGYGDLLNLLAIASAVAGFAVVAGGPAVSVARAIRERAPASGTPTLCGMAVAVMTACGISLADGGPGMPPLAAVAWSFGVGVAWLTTAGCLARLR